MARTAPDARPIHRPKGEPVDRKYKCLSTAAPPNVSLSETWSGPLPGGPADVTSTIGLATGNCPQLSTGRALVPAFRTSCYIAAHSCTNFGKQKGTSKFMIPVPLFDLKSLIVWAAPGAGTSNRRHRLRGGTEAAKDMRP